MEKTREDIINNALEWANFRECIPLEQEDVIILGEIFKVRIPQRFDKFEYSLNPNHARNTVENTVSEKIIYNTLSKIKTKLLNKFGENKVVAGRKKGCEFSKEQRLNMSKGQIRRIEREGKCGVNELRPVVKLSKTDGSFIAEYPHTRKATLELGKAPNRNDIYACCRGRRNKQSAFGYKWMYKDDYEELKKTFGVFTVEEINNFINHKYKECSDSKSL